MNQIKINNRFIGPGQPPFIIAEIGVNHNGDPDIAIALIDAAVDAGADCVKFQKRCLRELYPEKYLDNINMSEKTLRYLLPVLQQVELTETEYYKIKDYCQKKNIFLLCTPFDRTSAAFLIHLGVPAFKVASADMTNIPLLEYLVSFGKPLILSTGMSRIDEVAVTVNFLKDLKIPFALLHCSSTYPAAFEDINLKFMNKLKEFEVPVGYSGHERGITVSVVAAAMGACIIERHITLDRTMDGPDHASSLEPHAFKELVKNIHIAVISLGAGKEKYFSRGEILNREVLGKSLVAARDIEPGEIIDPDMIDVKGPAQGLSPQQYSKLIGKRVSRKIVKDSLFLKKDLGIHFKLNHKNKLPFEWGFPVRFKDFKELLQFNPKLLEFHLTDTDLDENFSIEPLQMKLVVHAPEFWDRTLVDLCSEDSNLRKDSVALIQKSIDFTRRLSPNFQDIPKVIVHPGAMTRKSPILKNDYLYKNLKNSIKELNYDGVELLLENLPPRPWYFGGKWLTNAFMDAAEIIKFVSDCKINICFDTSHSKLYCNWVSKDFFEETKLLLPYTRHLHLADASGLDGEGLQVGEGNIDWIRFFEVITDYNGSIIPEIWRGHQREGEGFIIALYRLSEAYLKAHEK